MSVCSHVWVESSPTVHYDLCTTAKVTEGGMAKCSALFCCCCTLITGGFRRPRTIRILSEGFFKPVISVRLLPGLTEDVNSQFIYDDIGYYM